MDVIISGTGFCKREIFRINAIPSFGYAVNILNINSICKQKTQDKFTSALRNQKINE